MSYQKVQCPTKSPMSYQKSNVLPDSPIPDQIVRPSYQKVQCPTAKCDRPTRKTKDAPTMGLSNPDLLAPRRDNRNVRIDMRHGAHLLCRHSANILHAFFGESGHQLGLFSAAVGQRWPSLLNKRHLASNQSPTATINYSQIWIAAGNL